MESNEMHSGEAGKPFSFNVDNVDIYTILVDKKGQTPSVAKAITTLGYPSFNLPHLKDHEDIQTALRKLSEAVSSTVTDILSHMGDS